LPATQIGERGDPGRRKREGKDKVETSSCGGKTGWGVINIAFSGGSKRKEASS